MRSAFKFAAVPPTLTRTHTYLQAQNKQERWQHKHARKEDRAVVREQEHRKREDSALLEQWRSASEGDRRRLGARIQDLLATIHGREEADQARQARALRELSARQELDTRINPTLLAYREYHAARDRALDYIEAADAPDPARLRALLEEVLRAGPDSSR